MSGWGLDPWGLFSWGALATAAGFQGGMGSVSHTVDGPGGSVLLPILDGWSADEEANGGPVGMSGAVPPSVLEVAPDVLVDGATLTSWLDESAIPLWGGTLRDPVRSGDRVHLTAVGWAALAEEWVQRMLFQSYYLGDWSPRDSDPFEYAQNSSTIDLSTDGALRWKVANQTDIGSGDEAGVVLWAQGDSITRLAFSIRHTVSSNYGLRVRGATGPQGTRVDLYSPSFASALGDQDLVIPGYDLVEIALRRTGASGLSGGLVATLNGVRVNGRLLGDTASADAVAGVVAAQLGIGAGLVRPVAGNVLPVDVRNAPARQALDLVTLQTDTRWRMAPTARGPVLDLDRWDATTWELLDPEQEFRPVPVRRYRRVRVPFTYASGRAIGYAEAAADLPGLNTDRTLTVPLRDPLRNEETAAAMAARVAEYVATLRVAGDFRASSVRDPSGAPVSAHHVRAGDSLSVPGEGTFRVRSLHRTGAEVSGAFDDANAVVDAILATEDRRLARSGAAERGG